MDLFVKLPNFALSILVTILLLITVVGGSAQDSLSNGEPTLLWHGQTLSERKDTLREGEFSRYQDAFEEFPTVENCMEEKADNTELEDRKFVWNQMPTQEMVEWCVFLIAVELQSVEKLTEWFIRNDLKLLKIEKDQRRMQIYRYNGPGVVFSASHNLEGPNSPLGWWSRFMAYGLSIVVATTTDGVPLSVGSTLLIL
ncbi:hypothetical protein [Sulfitobacter sp. 1A12157]|uniref:hypothetical protein n=1 Tax=Sulfitobacter sp. 1A12157 TaxID=3368594 RepID=UPI003746BA7F